MLVFIIGFLLKLNKRIVPLRIEIKMVSFNPREIPHYGINMKPAKKAPRMLPNVLIM